MSHDHALFMHFLFLLLVRFVIGTFLSVCLSVCLSLSLSPSHNLLMAPKRKSAPSQNRLRFKSSSSNPTPLSVQFCDEKTHQDFSENFSRRGIHLEHHVILSDFSDTTLSTVIHSR